MTDPFIKVNKSNSNTQLILFPFLGGSASSFRPLINQINNRVDVAIWIANPPGRGGSTQALLHSMDTLVEYFVNAYKTIVNDNTILFGHSMGGIVIYHLMQHLTSVKDCLKKPKCLILSASGPGETLDRTLYSTYSTQSLIERLAKFGGIPKEIVTTQSLQNLFVPIFRADYQIMESVMHYSPKEKLDLKVYQVCGEHDQETTISDSMKWLDYFTPAVNMRIVKSGNHMFINDYANTVSDYIVDIIGKEIKMVK